MTDAMVRLFIYRIRLMRSSSINAKLTACGFLYNITQGIVLKLNKCVACGGGEGLTFATVVVFINCG